MASLAARRVYRTWLIDSRRWEHYRPRRDDIIIATYPKCGTTWMQQIISLLVFQTTAPRPLMQISPWLERRVPVPIETVTAQLEAQTHRRFLKCHLPADGVPLFDRVRYVFVARDGRDACMSYHNHCRAMTPETLQMLDEVGLHDDMLRRSYPRPPEDPAAFFRKWISQGVMPGHHDGLPMLSFFRLVRSWWEERLRPNVLLVHYNDLTADLDGEMRRIARFLNITVPESLWPELVAAARFDSMRRQGHALLPDLGAMFEGGAQRFLYRASNGRWRGVLTDEDLARYDAKVTGLLPPACAWWIGHGRLVAGDPTASFDRFTSRPGAGSTKVRDPLLA